MKAKASIYVCELPQEQINLLRELGLSDHEIQLYQILTSTDQPMSAQDVASKMMVYPSALYRLFEELINWGLVVNLGGRPRLYKAVDNEIGLSAAVSIKQGRMIELLDSADIASKYSPSRQLVVGRDAQYRLYADLADLAKDSIDIFAIGIAYNPKLFKVQQKAIDIGVKIRHVVQRRKFDNTHVIKKWLNLGVDIRYHQDSPGYHLVIIDQKIALITFSDPEDTDDRITLKTDQANAVKLFQTQFNQIWDSSQELKI